MRMPKLTLRHALVFGVIGFGMQAMPSFALGLLQAYDAALQNDPTYRSAIFENKAGQENKAIGRSNLLPNAQYSYSGAKNRSDLTEPNFVGQLITVHPEYSSSSSQISVRQVLFSLDAYARYKQGVAQSDYSDAVFSSRRQDLVIRLVSAYAEAKYAEDQLTVLNAQRDAYAEQRRVNDRMFEKGEGTKTDMLETQAKLDLAEAQIIEAQDNLTTARNTLAAIIGQDVTALNGLVDNFRLISSLPASYEEWQEIALKNNAEILAGQFAIEAAYQEYKKSWAGHTPRVDLQASYGRSKSDTLNTLNQDSTSKTIGFQVVIPLYSGGLVNAQSRQSLASWEKAKADLDVTIKKVTVELRKQYSALISSVAKIDALSKSVNSANLLVQATEQSVRGGVRINLDVLNAQQQKTQSTRDLAQARYNYLLSYLRLRNAAGTLNGDDVVTVSKYFVAGN